MTAFVYNQTVAQARLQKVIDAIDAGAGVGTLVVGTSALAGAVGVLATFSLNKPSATIAVRTMTFAGTPKSTVATGTGIAAKAELRDSTGLVVCSGLTVGVVGSACDIIIDSTSIINGRTTFFLSGAITHT